MKNILTIAGSDSSGGAGIQADLKTFSANQTFGMSVITAVTAQNTQGVFAVQNINPEIIAAQIYAIFTDIPVHAVKVGMVSSEAAISVIAEKLNLYKPPFVVLDPVMISKSGYSLLESEAKQALIQKLLPCAFLLTPNIPEAEALAQMTIHTISDMELAAKKLAGLGPQAVLVKGGHFEGGATDILFDGTNTTAFSKARIPTNNTHGTGCTLSSAIAAFLGRGETLAHAVGKAKAYIDMAIQHGFSLGHGVGPTHHFYELYKRAGLYNS